MIKIRELSHGGGGHNGLKPYIMCIYSIKISTSNINFNGFKWEIVICRCKLTKKSSFWMQCKQKNSILKIGLIKKFSSFTI